MSPWLPLIMVSIYLRAIGQTLMVNNVISGSLILASFNLEQSISTWVSFVCAFSTSMAIYTSKSEAEGFKLKKWIHQGWTTSPAIWLAHHLVTHACFHRSMDQEIVNVYCYKWYISHFNSYISCRVVDPNQREKKTRRKSSRMSHGGDSSHHPDEIDKVHTLFANFSCHLFYKGSTLLTIFDFRAINFLQCFFRNWTKRASLMMMTET